MVVTASESRYIWIVFGGLFCAIGWSSHFTECTSCQSGIAHKPFTSRFICNEEAKVPTFALFDSGVGDAYGMYGYWGHLTADEDTACVKWNSHKWELAAVEAFVYFEAMCNALPGTVDVFSNVLDSMTFYYTGIKTVYTASYCRTVIRREVLCSLCNHCKLFVV